MPRRGPLVKQIRKFLMEFPPANFAPWKKPNNKMKKIIDTQIRGKLGATIRSIEAQVLRQHTQKVLRKYEQNK